MKFAIYFLIFLFIFHGKSYAQDYPTTGLLYNTKEVSSLVYYCTKNDNNLLECQFTQTSVRKKADPRSIEDIKERAKKELDAAKKDMSDGECHSIELLIKATRGDISLEEASKSGFISDKDTFIKEMKSSSKKKKEFLIESMSSLLDFCKNPTEDNLVNVIKTANKRDTLTCEVGPNTYKQTFQFVNDAVSGEGTWVVISSPTGPCGVINLSRFERAPNTDIPFWNYVAKKTITNPKGKILGLNSCSVLDEDEYLYTWNSKEHFMGCEIIEFSPF